MGCDGVDAYVPFSPWEMVVGGRDDVATGKVACAGAEAAVGIDLAWSKGLWEFCPCVADLWREMEVERED